MKFSQIIPVCGQFLEDIQLRATKIGVSNLLSIIPVMKRPEEFETRTEDSKRVKTETDSEKVKTESVFRIQPLVQYEGLFPYFRQPKQIGYFSQDKNRIFKPDKSSLKYLRLPEDVNNVSYPIWTGFEKFIEKDDGIKEYLNTLLNWILLNKSCFYVPSTGFNNKKELNTKHHDDHSKHNLNKFCLNTDFVSWRGLLSRLLCTPFENRDGWKIACTLYNGTIYMCEFETQERKMQKAALTEREKVICYGGFKFEQYLCSESPERIPDTTVPVNNVEGFCSIVRTRLKHHSLVYGGEVDCCEDDEGNNFIELKTTREVYTSRNDYSLKRFKLIKWWAQSFLIGIGKIVVGFRNDNGIVKRLETYNTMEIPKMCKVMRNTWDANVCFNFLDGILNHFKQVVTEDNPRTVYLFEWKINDTVVTCTKQPENSEYVFIPEWYCEALESQKSTSNNDKSNTV